MGCITLDEVQCDSDLTGEKVEIGGIEILARHRDGDGGDDDIGDPIRLFSFLFLGLAAPTYPGSEIPGADPTVDNLYCLEAQ